MASSGSDILSERLEAIRRKPVDKTKQISARTATSFLLNRLSTLGGIDMHKGILRTRYAAKILTDHDAIALWDNCFCLDHPDMMFEMRLKRLKEDRELEASCFKTVVSYIENIYFEDLEDDFFYID